MRLHFRVKNGLARNRWLTIDVWPPQHVASNKFRLAKKAGKFSLREDCGAWSLMRRVVVKTLGNLTFGRDREQKDRKIGPSAFASRVAWVT